jgi:hypothetical protein
VLVGSSRGEGWQMVCTSAVGAMAQQIANMIVTVMLGWNR